MEVIQKDIQTLYKRVDEISKDVAKLKEKAHIIDITDLQREHELRTLIAEAVERGNEKNSMVVANLDEKLTAFSERIEKRIHDLEDAETNRLAEQARQAQRDKRENRKHARNVAIATIVTFFATIFLNNFWTIIIDALFRRGPA